MGHITVLAVFEKEPENIEIACIEAMEPYEEGTRRAREEWDYFEVQEWRGKVRDYPEKGYLYALIDPNGDWVDGQDLYPALEAHADDFAVEIDAHR